MYFLMQRGLFARLTNKYDFNVKIYPSIMSKVIPFDYSLIIRPYLGGIYRTQIFSTFDNEYSLGINKTSPMLLTKNLKSFSSKKYANKSEYRFSSTPLFPYFFTSGKVDENKRKCDRRLNRYHFYIEITDFCNNIEIWYMSFSLLLNNIKEPYKNWHKCTFNYGYEYYTFDDLNIVSPRDIPKNFDRANNFNKTLKEIEGKEENSHDSTTLIEHGFDTMNQSLQLFEMKEYIAFLKKLSNDKIK